MNIAIATSEFVTEGVSGGYGRYVANLSKTLVEHGHKVFIVVLSAYEGEFEWKEGIVVCRANQSVSSFMDILKQPFKLMKIISPIWRVYGSSYLINEKIKKLDKKYNIDVIQTSNIHGINIFRNKKIPTVVMVAGNPVLNFPALNYDYNYEEAKKTKAKLIYELCLKKLKNADYVFASSFFAANEIGRRYDIDIDVIETPYEDFVEIDDSLYEKTLKGKRYFLFFSSLNFLKGIRALAECLDDLLANQADMSFVFCGTDCDVKVRDRELKASEYIIENVKNNRDRVFFLDNVREKSKLYGIISHSTACVMPSRVDNLPNTCIEAMSLGKIVIGTNGASYEQLIRDGVSGFLCDIDDSQSLLGKMLKVAKLSSEEKNIIEDNAIKTIQRMSSEEIYKKMIKVYNSVLME